MKNIQLVISALSLILLAACFNSSKQPESTLVARASTSESTIPDNSFKQEAPDDFFACPDLSGDYTKARLLSGIATNREGALVSNGPFIWKLEDNPEKPIKDQSFNILNKASENFSQYSKSSGPMIGFNKQGDFWEHCVLSNRQVLSEQLTMTLSNMNDFVKVEKIKVDCPTLTPVKKADLEKEELRTKKYTVPFGGDGNDISFAVDNYRDVPVENIAPKSLSVDGGRYGTAFCHYGTDQQGGLITAVAALPPVSEAEGTSVYIRTSMDGSSGEAIRIVFKAKSGS